MASEDAHSRHEATKTEAQEREERKTAGDRQGDRQNTSRDLPCVKIAPRYSSCVPAAQKHFLFLVGALVRERGLQ